MVPNHALIIHALLHGDGDFGKSLMIVNTCGWDTDCNSGNLGCLLGIRGGLAAIDSGPDWRGPVADRMYLPSADGGRAITDAATEAMHIVNIARDLHGAEAPIHKAGARFHFELPGSVQGFAATAAGAEIGIENVLGHSTAGQRSLAIHFHATSATMPARIATPTYIPPDTLNVVGYDIMASPTLYPGQIVRARVAADSLNEAPATVALQLSYYNDDNSLKQLSGASAIMLPGATAHLEWIVPPTNGPIAEIGLDIISDSSQRGTVYLDYLTWDSAPQATFPPTIGRKFDGWVSAMDNVATEGDYHDLTQNEGRGFLLCGTREWTDYRFTATLTPKLADAIGIAARVQGLRRYYALLIEHTGKARLVKSLDGETTLAETDIEWILEDRYELALDIAGDRIRAFIGGELRFDVTDSISPLIGGGIGLVVDNGYALAADVRVETTKL